MACSRCWARRCWRTSAWSRSSSLAPASWFGVAIEREPENVMTISLGGATGSARRRHDDDGRAADPASDAGRSQAGDRTGPAAGGAEPEMIEPKKTAPRRPKPRSRTRRRIRASRTPTKGEEVQKGQRGRPTPAAAVRASVCRRAAAGPAAISTPRTSAAPSTSSTMLELIRRNWDSKQQAPGINGREVHDSARRHADQRASREVERLSRRSTSWPRARCC